MAVSAEDRLAISELIALHGHIMDSGELDRLENLFSPRSSTTWGTSGSAMPRPPTAWANILLSTLMAPLAMEQASSRVMAKRASAEEMLMVRPPSRSRGRAR